MPDPYRELTDSSAETPAMPLTSDPLNSAEQEILELEQMLAQKKASLGREKEKPLEQIIGAEKPASMGSPVATAPIALVGAIGATIPKPEAHQFKRYEKNQQLKNLVDLAFQKGIIYATDVARDMDNPFLMDEFHDALVDQLHKELVMKGKLEEI